MAGIRIGASGLIRGAAWAQDRLRAFGIELPPGNRLVKAGRLIEDINDGKIPLRPDDEATLIRVTESQWTIVEQYIIARSLGRVGQPLSTGLVDKLGQMLSGAETEDEDRNPVARNTQFELYTSAMLTMGDVSTKIAEPDLRADYLGTEIGVAAKRVRSLKQLPRRAKEAVEQIRKSGIPGIVALNVDVLLKASSPDVTGDEPLDQRLLALREIDEILSGEECVVGCLAFARDTVWDFGGEKPSVGFASTQRFSTYPRSEAQKDQGVEFWRRVRDKIDVRLENL